MPVGCFTQQLKLTGGVDQIKNKTYISATCRRRPPLPRFYDKLKDDQSWTVHTLPCTHIVQIDMPERIDGVVAAGDLERRFAGGMADAAKFRGQSLDPTNLVVRKNPVMPFWPAARYHKFASGPKKS